MKPVAEGLPHDESTHGAHEQPLAEHGDAHPTKVMLLGSGEFSRELAIALQRLGAHVIAVERYADAPAHGVADQSLVVDMTDADQLGVLIPGYEFGSAQLGEQNTAHRGCVRWKPAADMNNAGKSPACWHA